MLPEFLHIYFSSLINYFPPAKKKPQSLGKQCLKRGWMYYEGDKEINRQDPWVGDATQRVKQKMWQPFVLRLKLSKQPGMYNMSFCQKQSDLMK